MSTSPASSSVPDAAPGVRRCDVDRVLDRRAVGGPLLVRRQRGEADHLVGRRPSTATIAANAPDRAASQRPLVVQRPGDEVERARRAW